MTRFLLFIKEKSGHDNANKRTVAALRPTHAIFDLENSPPEIEIPQICRFWTRPRKIVYCRTIKRVSDCCCSSAVLQFTIKYINIVMFGRQSFPTKSVHPYSVQVIYMFKYNGWNAYFMFVKLIRKLQLAADISMHCRAHIIDKFTDERNTAAASTMKTAWQVIYNRLYSSKIVSVMKTFLKGCRWHFERYRRKCEIVVRTVKFAGVVSTCDKNLNTNAIDAPLFLLLCGC